MVAGSGRNASLVETDTGSNRRRFLKWLIGVSFAAFGVAFALPALALRSLSQEKKEIAAGDLLVYATGDRAGQVVNASEIALLGAVQAFPQGKETAQDNLVELVRLTEDPAGIVAYSAICTHLGCTVLPSLTEDGNIMCPCHVSIFDPADNAEVISGPAGRPLPSLPIEIGPDGAILSAGKFIGDVGPE